MNIFMCHLCLYHWLIVCNINVFKKLLSSNINFINILSIFVPNCLIEKFVHVATWKKLLVSLCSMRSKSESLNFGSYLITRFE